MHGGYCRSGLGSISLQKSPQITFFWAQSHLNKIKITESYAALLFKLGGGVYQSFEGTTFGLFQVVNFLNPKEFSFLDLPIAACNKISRILLNRMVKVRGFRMDLIFFHVVWFDQMCLSILEGRQVYGLFAWAYFGLHFFEWGFLKLVLAFQEIHFDIALPLQISDLFLSKSHHLYKVLKFIFKFSLFFELKFNSRLYLFILLSKGLAKRLKLILYFGCCSLQIK